jgi:hypothetical protein
MEKNSHYTAHFSTAPRNNTGFVIKRNADNEELFRCERSHRAIKDAYFAFGLANYNIDDFFSYVDSCENRTLPLFGDLSPEAGPISEFQR